MINLLIQHLNYTASLCQSLTGTSCSTGLPNTTADNSTIPSILAIVFAILGALAVLMIVIGGLRFVTGQGNPQETAKARSTIIYAIVGLLLAIASESIVALVLGKL